MPSKGGDTMDKQIMCCNKPMIHTSLGYYECEVCKKRLEDDLGLIKRTLKEYPNANALELAQLTKLPNRVILKYLNEGDLNSVEQPKNIKGCYVTPKEATPKWHIDIKKF